MAWLDSANLNSYILMHCEDRSIGKLFAVSKTFQQLDQDMFWYNLVRFKLGTWQDWTHYKDKFKFICWKQYYLDVTYWLYHDRTSIKPLMQADRLDILKLLHNKRKITFSGGTADVACYYGHVDILDWLAQLNILPTESGANQALSRHLTLLNRLKVTYNQEGVNLACQRGNLQALQLAWEEQQLLPEVVSINEAASNGHIHVLSWLAHQGLWVNADGLNRLIRTGPLEVLDWLYERQIRLEGVNTGRLAYSTLPGILDWSESKGIHIHALGLYQAVSNGCLYNLQWLALRGRYPTTMAPAAYNGHIHILDWAEQTCPKLINKDLTSEAVEGGQLMVLDWLAQRYILPCRHGANIAFMKGYLDICKWFECRYVYPSKDYLEYVEAKCDFNMLEWYYSLNI